MAKSTEAEKFITVHISEAAWLIVKGFMPEAFVNSIGIVAWKFDKTTDIETSVKEYLNNGLIGISDFNETVSMLRRGMAHIRGK